MVIFHRLNKIAICTNSVYRHWRNSETLVRYRGEGGGPGRENPEGGDPGVGGPEGGVGVTGDRICLKEPEKDNSNDQDF